MKILGYFLKRAIAATCISTIFAFAAWAGSDQKINTNSDGVAIEGYDTVAYFTEGRYVQGKDSIKQTWQDAEWRFSSTKHREMFAASPERYAPRYGGFCAMAMARGLEYRVDPKQWVIVKGKLYLNYSKVYRDKFVADKDQAIERADENWEGLGKIE